MKERVENNVYDLRSKRGITQEGLAEHMQVSRQTVIAIERGNYTPSVLLAMKIAKFFRTPVENIFRVTYEK